MNPNQQTPQEKAEKLIKKAKKHLATLNEKLKTVENRQTLFKIDDDAFSIEILIAEAEQLIPSITDKTLQSGFKKLKIDFLKLQNDIDIAHLHFDLASRLRRLAKLPVDHPDYKDKLEKILQDMNILKELTEPSPFGSPKFIHRTHDDKTRSAQTQTDKKATATPLQSFTWLRENIKPTANAAASETKAAPPTNTKK